MAAAKPELHLFIIWEKARTHEQAILEDIRATFTVLKTYEIHWSKQKFSQNLTRFYGLNLPPGSGKEEHVGTGPFLLVIVEDKQPEYRQHDTSKGQALVNSRTFLAKTQHREWTGGGHRTHATNSPQETEHDLMLLLGMNGQDFRAQLSKATATKPEVYKHDLIGADGWDSLKQLFYVLNATTPYLVMRNFAPLPDKYYADQHGDIDLLVADYAETCYVTSAVPVFAEEYRVHNKVMIGGQDVLFDFRFVGDNYYDARWQKDMLERRVLHQGFYVPNVEDHFYSLLYHGLLHKPTFADDYRQQLTGLGKVLGIQLPNDTRQMCLLLKGFMKRSSYKFTKPNDSSVLSNPQHWAIVSSKRAALKRQMAKLLPKRRTKS